MAKRKAAQALLPLPEPITPEQESIEIAERELNRSRQILENHTTLMHVEQAEVYSLDTETERFDKELGINSLNAKMLGMSVSGNGYQALYSTDRDVWQSLMPRPGQRVVMHNAKFDRLVLMNAGLGALNPDQFEDTKIACFLVDENRFPSAFGKPYSLKALAHDWLKVADPMLYDEAEAKGKILDPEIFEEYARNDARYTMRLWNLVEPELKEQGLVKVYQLEKELIPVLNSMESIGMKIDVSKLDHLRAETAKVMSNAQQSVYDLAGREFNLNSPQQLAEVLFDELGLPCKFYTDKGGRSTDKESLAYLEPYHKIIPHLQAYKECSKLDSSFLKALPRFIDGNNRIHPTFNAQGAKTGRFSCSEPNVQQIPSRTALGQEIRKAFIPEKGMKLVVADYSAMELRVLASYVYKTAKIISYVPGEPVERPDDSLLKLVMTSDPHAETAARMFGLTVDEVLEIHKDKRAVAKWINFGIVYGITASGLGARLRAIGQDVTDQDADRFIKQYMATYPGVRKFMQVATTFTQDNGFIRNAYGRRRRVSGWQNREIRQAINYVIQSTAADIVKSAMVNLHAMLPKGARILAQIHDELICECDEAIADQVKHIVETAMTEANPNMVCPMKVDAHIGDSWAEAKG